MLGECMRMGWKWGGKSDSKLSGVWLECKCHHFTQRTRTSQQSSCFRHSWICQFIFYIFEHSSGIICQLTYTRFPFFFSVSKTLQKCFPNPSVPLSFLVITSRPSHALPTAVFPNLPPAPQVWVLPEDKLSLMLWPRAKTGRARYNCLVDKVGFFVFSKRANWFWIVLLLFHSYKQ